jgi:hypothetical protein
MSGVLVELLKKRLQYAAGLVVQDFRKGKVGRLGCGACAAAPWTMDLDYF